MQRIEVHPDLLDKKAQLVQQKRQELERMVRELEKSIYYLQMEWSGATRERFFADFIRMKEVFPATLKHLEEMQKDLTSTSMLFRTTDESGNSFVRLPELEHNFRKGFLDKFFGEQLIGLGHTTKAFINDPSGTVSDIAYAMTIGKVVDAGRGIKFAWDAAWGNGTARSEVEQIVAEQKKQMDEEGVRYYSGSMTGQVVAYFIFGKALRKADSKHSDLGGSGGGRTDNRPGEKKNTELSEPMKVKTNKGLEVNFKNPSGNTIHWVEQNPNNIRNAIRESLKSPNAGKALEGKVGEHVNKITEVTGFGLKAKNITTNELAGDLDVVTIKQIIEVKKSTAALDMEQIDKYINPDNPKFFNYDMKEVVVYFDKPIDMNNKYVSENINHLKDSGVTVVNSLDELGGILK